MSQTSTERLRDYLAQLPPQSQALLMREFERAIERGEDMVVANFVDFAGNASLQNTLQHPDGSACQPWSATWLSG